MAVRESQLRTPTLQILAKTPSGFMTIAKLIGELEDIFKPDGKDAQIALNRSDTYFSQKVRNLTSHRTSSTSLIKRGLVTYDKERQGFQITALGRDYLTSKGL
jgi:hypothetical protein